MTAAPPPDDRLAGAVRRVGLACAVLACVAVPALLAGVGIDAPPAPGELDRLRAAYEVTGPSRLADWFALMTTPAVAAWPEDPAAVERLLATSRLAQVLGILGLSMLVYLATALARGRLAALAACLGLACLPAIGGQGSVLRPETAAALFTALGLLLLQFLTFSVHVHRARSPLRRVVVLGALALSAALAFGLAVGTAPMLGGALLLPLVLAMLVALQTGLRGLRVLRGRGVVALPSQAITARLWAPVVCALLTFVMALLCLRASLVPAAGDPVASLSAAAMWPEHLLGAWLLPPLAGLGALAFLLRTGVRFGRRGRAGPGLVLLIYCATQVFYGLASHDRQDPLPSAPAVAILFGEGVLALVSFGGWLRRRARRAVRR